MVGLQKEINWRSPKYLKWVRTLPCCICGGGGGDAHHIIGTGGLSGMGMKAPDWAVMPMCRTCHDSQHKATWKGHIDQQWEYISRTLGKALSEGELK